jgi:LysM repeat protein
MCKRSVSVQYVTALLLLVAACRSKTTAAVPTPVAMTPSSTATYTPVPATATSTPVVHVVQPGDSLSVIAAQYDVPMEAIVEANAIEDPDRIEVGQQIIIPGPTPIPTATVLPTIAPTPDVPPELEISDVIGRGAPATETVILVNVGRGVSLEGWSLRDAQENVFIFPKVYLATGAELRVHTGVGEDTPQHLYWNRDTAVWTESGDVAVLADGRGVMYASKPLD